MNRSNDSSYKIIEPFINTSQNIINRFINKNNIQYINYIDCTIDSTNDIYKKQLVKKYIDRYNYILECTNNIMNGTLDNIISYYSQGMILKKNKYISIQMFNTLIKNKITIDDITLDNLYNDKINSIKLNSGWAVYSIQNIFTFYNIESINKNIKRTFSFLRLLPLFEYKNKILKTSILNDFNYNNQIDWNDHIYIISIKEYNKMDHFIELLNGNIIFEINKDKIKILNTSIPYIESIDEDDDYY